MHRRRREAGRRGDALVLVVVAVVLVAMVVSALLPTSDEQPELGPGPDRGQTNPSGIIVIGPSEAADDRIVARLQSSGPGPPWLAFEVCADDPPGCAPLWTYSLEQAGRVTTAEVRKPDTFVAPDGIRHDCGAVGACVVRVTAGAGTASYSIFEPTEPGGPTTPAPVDELSVSSEVSPSSERPAPVAVTGGSPRAAVEVYACGPGDDRDRCPLVHVDRTDDAGRSAFALTFPMRVGGFTDTSAGPIRTETDCRRSRCELVVVVDGRHGSLAFTVPETDRSPREELRFVEPGPFTVGDNIVLEGVGFPVLSPTRTTRARWVLCEKRPASLDGLPSVCGSPRSVRVASIADDGSFHLPVTVPASGSVRTWIGAHPVDCEPRCWVVALAEPFPRVVAIPLDVQARS